VHLLAADIPPAPEQLEDGKDRPGPRPDHDVHIAGQDAGDVVEETSAREMGHRVNEVLREEGLEHLEVGKVRREQRVGDRPAAELLQPVVRPLAEVLEEDPARERVALRRPADGNRLATSSPTRNRRESSY
jgi:hypothetical protein